jgi:hypothetical protein
MGKLTNLLNKTLNPTGAPVTNSVDTEWAEEKVSTTHIKYTKSDLLVEMNQTNASGKYIVILKKGDTVISKNSLNRKKALKKVQSLIDIN